jgi:hypothetical protein
MTEQYIKSHFSDIKQYASVIEQRMDDEWCTMESVLADNAEMRRRAEQYGVNCIFIDDSYQINLDL